MRQFQYASSSDVQSAIAALAANPQSRFVAGGTTLIDLMKLEVETPEHLIDINKLPLDKIEESGNGDIRIGAMARNSDVAFHPLIASRHSILSEALLAGASPQLRNMATIGGNLMQRVRCTYFRDVRWPCNKRSPGSGCSAMDGYHRNHAIFGTSEDCFATHPSDMCVALTALDAAIEIEEPSGVRQVPISQFYPLPGKTPHIETVLEHGELITAVILPKPAAEWRAKYLKVRDRASYEFALVSVAALLDVAGGRIRGARIAFGGVGTIPWRANGAEQALVGSMAGEESFRAAAERAVEGAAPRRDNRFKVELLKRSLIRTLRDLTGGPA